MLGVQPDLVDADLLQLSNSAGAVCWNASPASFIDCASWGAFTGDASLPSSAGTPAFSPVAIPDGDVISGNTSRGCQSFLEASDDTDNSESDFSGGLPVPRNNATSPTEEPCLNTRITKGPDGKTKDRTPTFKFESVPSGAANFQCAIDDKSDAGFDTCESPVTVPRLSRGKHKFYVRASNSLFAPDPTPDARAFEVVKSR